MINGFWQAPGTGRSAESPGAPWGPDWPDRGGLEIESLTLARNIAAILESMKGTEIALLDVREKFGLADYFLIASADNRRLVQSLVEEIDRQQKAAGVPKPRIEGKSVGWWALLDYGDVVVHIFREEARAYYDLDLLWADAPRMEWRLPDQEQAG